MRHTEDLYKDTLKKNFENLVYLAIFELGKEPRDYCDTQSIKSTFHRFNF